MNGIPEQLTLDDAQSASPITLTEKKRCFRCNQVKQIEEFYRGRRMADGHLNKCKECTKRDVSKNYRVRKLQYMAYEQERNRRPERKEKALEYQKTRRANNPNKYKAHCTVNNALRDGNLTKQPCEVCGNPRVEAHHDDYTKPLDVRWLCFEHHRQIHGQEVFMCQVLKDADELGF
jgi:hypothetical protein